MTRKKKETTTKQQQAKHADELRDEELKDVAGGHAPAAITAIDGEAKDKDHGSEIDILP